MLKRVKWIALGAAFALVAAFVGSTLQTSTARAETMYLDFAQSRLDGTWDDCMARVRRALPAEGWAIGGEYGAPVRGGYFIAWKGNHGVIVACDIEPAGGTIFHMTMSGLDEGNRPLIDSLIAQIRGGRPSGPTGPGGVVAEGRVLKVSLGPGGQVSVSWQGLTAGSADWISIRPVGTADDTYDDHWKYTGGAVSGSMDLGTLTPGDYEARLYLNWPAGGYNVAERVRFRVP